MKLTHTLGNGDSRKLRGGVTTCKQQPVIWGNDLLSWVTILVPGHQFRRRNTPLRCHQSFPKLRGSPLDFYGSDFLNIRAGCPSDAHSTAALFENLFFVLPWGVIFQFSGYIELNLKPSMVLEIYD